MRRICGTAEICGRKFAICGREKHRPQTHIQLGKKKSYIEIIGSSAKRKKINKIKISREKTRESREMRRRRWIRRRSGSLS